MWFSSIPYSSSGCKGRVLALETPDILMKKSISLPAYRTHTTIFPVFYIGCCHRRDIILCCGRSLWVVLENLEFSNGVLFNSYELYCSPTQTRSLLSDTPATLEHSDLFSECVPSPLARWLHPRRRVRPRLETLYGVETRLPSHRDEH